MMRTVDAGMQHRLISFLIMLTMIAMIDSGRTQPAPETAKFQPAILRLRSCLKANAPPIYIGKMTNSAIDVFSHFKERCYPAFNSEITELGAGYAALGGFRLIAQEEWAAFLDHINSR